MQARPVAAVPVASAGFRRLPAWSGGQTAAKYAPFRPWMARMASGGEGGSPKRRVSLPR